MIELSIHSPDRTLVKKLAVEQVTLPSSEGQIEILPGHAFMAGTLQAGAFAFLDKDQKNHVGFISIGFFEVAQDQVHVMAEVLEKAEEIDVKRAERAQQISEEKLQSPELSQDHFRKYQLKLQRSLIRQQIAGKDHLE